MRFRVTTAAAATTAALVLATQPAPAQAAPDNCVWTPTTLADHPSVGRETAGGISPDGKVLIGDGTPDGTLNTPLRGILWLDGVPVDMASVGDVDNSPMDVTNSAVVAGYTYDANTDQARPYRYHDGSYEWLAIPADGSVVATAINEAGDIAGWSVNSDGTTSAVLWPATAPGAYVTIGAGYPIGLDEAGVVVTDNRLIRFPDGSTSTFKQRRDAKPLRYAEGRIVGSAGSDDTSEAVEWNLDGKVTRVVPGAGYLKGVNSRGTIVGMHEGVGQRHWAIWSSDTAQDIQGYAEGVGESDTAYGVATVNGRNEAAIFTCV
jgi:hypothetical protein